MEELPATFVIEDPEMFEILTVDGPVHFLRAVNSMPEVECPGSAESSNELQWRVMTCIAPFGRSHTAGEWAAAEHGNYRVGFISRGRSGIGLKDSVFFFPTQ